MFRNKRRQEPPKMEDMLQPFIPHKYATTPVIISQESEYRPCYVNGRKALFHRWVNTARPQLPKGQELSENARFYQFRTTHGLVEYEDGTMDQVWPRDIKFADHGRFRDYAWDAEEG
jgi:hypothetical protein